MARIPKDHYYEEAHVDPGDMIHVNHNECPAGRDTKRRLYIKNTGTKLLVYCHNCQGWDVQNIVSNSKFRAWVGPADDADVQDFIKNHDNDAHDTEAQLPDDVTNVKFPDECVKWLVSSGITAPDVDTYNITYSPSYDRVILPVYNSSGDLIYWQARSCNGKEPKYLNIKGHPKPLFILGNPTIAKRVIIVEDILSAIRLNKWDDSVGKGDNSIVGSSLIIALLGTKVDVSTLLNQIPDMSEAIYVWLDEDEPGRKAALALKNNLQLLYHSSNKVVYNVGAPQPKKILLDCDITSYLSYSSI
jgi:hypothetical protein